MPRTDTIVIGGGQAGLATSRYLSDAGRDHVVLEQGRLAESWRTQRWDSLRLLTPNWMTTLPGWSYDGPDPDGFMVAADLVSVLERYAEASAAPVHQETTVVAAEPDDRGWTVTTDQGTWRSRHLVVATGHCQRTAIPAFGATLPSGIHQVSADRYRNPGQLPDGGVLVVGASATGAQLAEELARAGRDVVLAVGRHRRMIRRYRGRDVFRWLGDMGTLDDRIDRHPNPGRAMRTPTPQLVGSVSHRDLDLATCQEAGVQLAGHLVGLDDGVARFADTLTRSVVESESRLGRTLDRIDAHIHRFGLGAARPGPHRPRPVPVGPSPASVDLRARGITTVLWATGYGRSYPWLAPPALDRRGEIRHHLGVGELDGLYVVGQRFQRRRDSNLIGGVGRDARVVVDHLSGRRDLVEEHAA